MDEEVRNARALAACQGKERFETCAKANKTLKRIEQRQRSPSYKGAHGSKVMAYRCPHCAGWHLGKDPARAKR